MTELIWDGKYKDCKKQGPVRIALPFQTIETVNETAQERQRSLELFTGGREAEWRNRLIWGDNKYVLAALLPEFGGRIGLIYIDPPFTTGLDFSFTATVPAYEQDEEDDPTVFLKQPSIIEQKAYRDTWGAGLDSYLQMMYERPTLMRELLSDTGTIYIHCDWRVNSPMRLILDEVFGNKNFMNEVIWKRDSAAKGAKKPPGNGQEKVTPYWFTERRKVLSSRRFTSQNLRTHSCANTFMKTLTVASLRRLHSVIIQMSP